MSRPRGVLVGLSVALAALAGCGGGGDEGGSSGGGGGGGGGGSGTATIGATGVPLVVLVGGSAKPTGSGVYLDSELDRGEIFIMPQAALALSTTYTVSVTAIAGTETFSHSWSFTTASTALPYTQANELAELNYLRTRSGVPSVSSNPGYVTSSTKHSGYQCETSALNHYEPDSGRTFYVANLPWDRINAGLIAESIAVGSSGWGVGISTVGEDVASNGGLDAVSLLWNSVYHRLPMMRTTSSIVGIADRTEAFAHALNSGPVIASTGSGYLTINFGGNNSAAQVQSYWPHDGETNVHYAFNTNSESPDPLGTNSGTDPNSAPAFDTVGTPIHIILPTVNNFTELTITVTP